MRSPFSLVLASALCLCVLGGCENNGGAVPLGPSVTASSTPTPVAVPTATPVPSPTPTAAPTPSPSPTPRPSPSPTPTATSTAVACPAIAFVAPQLAYPIPGATGVPTAAGNLVFYGSLPSSFTGLLTSASSSIELGAFGPAPSPLPSPLAPRGTGPGDGGEPLAGVAFPQLAPATTYTISFSDTGSCAMTIADPSYTFTTR